MSIDIHEPAGKTPADPPPRGLLARDLARFARLLESYTTKLKDLVDEILAVRELTEGWMFRANRPDELEQRNRCIRRFKYLMPPAEEVARTVSAIIESGRRTEFARVELWLRLADFEARLLDAKDAVQPLLKSS
jgi:hypothetical protein